MWNSNFIARSAIIIVFPIDASARYQPIHAIKWKTDNLTHRRFFRDNDDRTRHCTTRCGVTLKAGAHMWTTSEPNSLHYEHGKLIFREPKANTGHPAPPGTSNSLCVCAKTEKFQFAANSMWTVCRWCSASLQSCSHMHAFGSQTLCEQFSNHLVRTCVPSLT